MVKSIAMELKLRSTFVDEVIKTIYFGGGTPSLLDTADIEFLLATVFEQYSVSEEPEITLEANPEDIDAMKLLRWKEAGINRLSIGIQTFDDDRLGLINRSHVGRQAMDALEQVQMAGFRNYSCDLIYAIPPADMAVWKNDLEKALSFDPPHISLYSLTIEPRTVFGSQLKKGQITELSDQENAAQYDLAVHILKEAGYHHYEVSNFCKPGFISRHNSSYWKGSSYIGVGPGAHSYDQQNRLWNVSHNHQYISDIGKGNLPQTTEALTSLERANEYILTRLRTWMGIDLDYLRDELKVDLSRSHRKEISFLVESKFAEEDGPVLKLTDEGLARADEITLKFFQDES